jgi:hypothetical protein
MNGAEMRVARVSLRVILGASVTSLLAVGSAWAQAGGCSKPVTGDHIRKVEDGVDQFRKYTDNREENLKNNAESAKNNGGTKARRDAPNTEARKDQANRTKDELDDALGDLNSSTNKLRRKFDATSNYMNTRGDMEKVMESGRRVNQVMVRGKYGTQAERLWLPLRGYINDLGRCYGLSPMGGA